MPQLSAVLKLVYQGIRVRSLMTNFSPNIIQFSENLDIFLVNLIKDYSASEYLKLVHKIF